jgi:thiosulfate dehydrogenase (quinone) large subunit
VPARYLWALTRLSLSTVFLWALFDKVFGLGHETSVNHAWLDGGSPSVGFLGGATGPFADFYQAIAGAFMDNHIVYALVLLGIAVVGAGNTLGIGSWWTGTSLVRRFPWLT